MQDKEDPCEDCVHDGKSACLDRPCVGCPHEQWQHKKDHEKE